MARKKSPTPKFRLDPAHRKVLRASAKQIANERAAAETERRDRIRRELEQAQYRLVTDEHAEQVGRVVRGLRSTLGLVACSYPEWDPQVPINVAVRGPYGYAVQKVEAWTDFKQVVVRYPASRFSLNPDGSPTPDARDSVREVLGLGYHEIGHNLYTLPFDRLGLPTSHQRPWNALEDQRMELAVVASSPDLAAYLTIVVLRNIVDAIDGDVAQAWFLVAGRLYLPRSLRQECRAAFVDRYGDEAADKVKAIVRDYVEAETVAGLKDAVERLYELLNDLSTSVPDNTPGGEHDKFDSNDGEADESTAVRPVAVEGWDDDETDDDDDDEGDAPGEQVDGEDGAEGQAGQQADEQADGDDAKGSTDEGATAEGGGDDGAGQDDGAEGNGADGNDGSQSGGNAAGTEGSGKSSEESFKDAVQKALDDAVRETDNGSRLDDALREINNASTCGSTLPDARTSGVLEADEQAAAQALASDFERALEEAAAYNSPSWYRQQEQGVVDALAYRTRRPGATDFRRQRVGDSGRGLDIAVSILLDVSGSMDGQQRDLSVAALGVKTACWNLGIDCTVLTYDDHADLLWAASDAPVPTVVKIGGCTNVAPALRDAHNHRNDCSQHLVLVLTDGHFGDRDEAAAEVDSLIASGAYVLGLALNTWTDGLDAAGCNASFQIQQPGELARHVEDYLAGVVSGRA